MIRSLMVASALAALLSTSPALAKRTPPPVVPPIVSGNVQYAVAHEKILAGGAPVGMRAFVVKTEDDKVLWRTQVYQIDFDRKLETDVQEVYLASLRIGGVDVIATCERGRLFVLDPNSGRFQANSK